jgi:eukaryotic-like serine/threonine-protein kinase
MPLAPDGKPSVDDKPRRYPGGQFNAAWSRFSPDTRWVAYQSDESGRAEVYVDSFPEPHGRVQISTSGGAYPQWGPGGRELFYVSPANKLIAVSLKAGADSIEPSAPRELFPLPSVDLGINPYEAAPDGQRFLVFGTPEQAPQPLTVIVNWPALLKNGSAR